MSDNLTNEGTESEREKIHVSYILISAASLYSWVIDQKQFLCFYRVLFNFSPLRMIKAHVTKDVQESIYKKDCAFNITKTACVSTFKTLADKNSSKLRLNV